MQKKLLIFLTVLVIGLLIANVVVLTLGIQRLSEKKSVTVSEQVRLSPDAGSFGIKQGTFSKSFVSLSNSASDAQDSIGTQAGKTVGELQTKTQESYEALNQQAQETAAELDKTSQEAMKVLNEQTAKTAQDIQVAWADILQKFSVELNKFSEELKKKQTA